MKHTYRECTMTVKFNEDAIYDFIDNNMETLCEKMSEGDSREFGENVIVECTHNTMFVDESELDENENRFALYNLYTNLMTIKFSINLDGESYIEEMYIDSSLYLNSLNDMVSHEDI